MILAIVQARMGSTRLPGKVLKKVAGKTVIRHLLERLKHCKRIDQIVVATSLNPENDVLENHLKELGYEVFRGSEQDVLDRYYQCAKQYQADIVVRITGDCPLIDPKVIDQVVGLYLKEGADYSCNIVPRTYPDGLDVRVFSFKALEDAAINAKDVFDREHVDRFIRESKIYKRVALQFKEDLSRMRWTLDTPEDLQVIQGVLETLETRGKYLYSMHDVLNLMKDKPEIFKANQKDWGKY